MEFDELFSATVDWLSRVPVDNPASVEVAMLLDGFNDPPNVCVAGRPGMPVSVVAEALRELIGQQGRAWQVLKATTISQRLDTVADLYVDVVRDLAVPVEPVEPIVLLKTVKLDINQCVTGQQCAEALEPVIGSYFTGEKLLQLRAQRLREGLVEISTALPSFADGLVEIAASSHQRSRAVKWTNAKRHGAAC